MRDAKTTFDGRILYLTEDEALLRAQLYDGVDLPDGQDHKLIDNISTDELTPGWVCYYYDETLARYCLVGLRGGNVEKDAIKNGKFSVIVSGVSKGCGSSRETAPFSELKAGVRLVIAKNIEKIYGQNCQNIGLLTSTDFSLIDRIKNGEEISIDEFTEGLDPIAAEIVRHGGLFAYNKARLAGETAPPAVETPSRPMTLCEKIISRRAIADAKTGALGIDAVRPGDALFVRTDVRFSHEYVTPMAEALFKMGLGDDARVHDPGSVFAFRDHLTFLDKVMSQERIEQGLLDVANELEVKQRTFAEKQGVKLYGEQMGNRLGSQAICHSKILEEYAEPGMLIIGTDSHTPHAGAIGAVAFGVGTTAIFNSWITKDVRVKVPQSFKVVISGEPAPNVTAKDYMLEILRHPYIRDGEAIGQIIEYAGPAVEALSVDERATMTNMAAEVGAFTGIIAADEKSVEFMVNERGMSRARAEELISGMQSDPEAEYVKVIEIDASVIRPMAALPNDPGNGVFIDELGDAPIRIDIAYAGSCTAGKKEDMDMYARVFADADEQGLRVHPDVQVFIQCGSTEVREYCREQGYLELFERMGAEFIEPGCGACIAAGPGVTSSPDEVSISSQNRNFPGRSGPGNLYLGSPYSVAASAVCGYVTSWTPGQHFEPVDARKLATV